MLIFVKGAKGRKYRYTLLSPKALALIDLYITRYEPRKWLFEGAKAGRYLSKRSIEKVFDQACERAGIKIERKDQVCSQSWNRPIPPNLGVKLHQSAIRNELYEIPNPAVEKIKYLNVGSLLGKRCDCHGQTL